MAVKTADIPASPSTRPRWAPSTTTQIFIGLFAGVAIGYLSDLSNKVVDKNLPLIDAVEILLLKIPEFTAYSLPISLLLATLLAYGRLSNDSELVALFQVRLLSEIAGQQDSPFII